MGFETRYDRDGGGNHIEHERRRERRKGLSVVVDNKRFCECCKSRKPRSGPSFKGWKCDDCIGRGE